ncbi:MAG: proton-conducting transporter membrane subunit [Crocinitomicaceae bacterium]
MLEKFELIIFLLPTLLLFFTGFYSRFEKGRLPGRTILLSRLSIYIGFGLAVAGSFLVFSKGQMELDVFSIANLGLTIRIDSLSMVMYSMIAILGFVVLRYSYNYLSGDNRHAIFIGRMAATIGAVQLLVLSGNLLALFFAWMIASIALHKLILFFSGRVKAQNAAKKKFIIARLSDLTLLTSFVLIYTQFGTGNLSEIFAAIKSQQGTSTFMLEWSAFFLVLAAIFKSAQFPTHGWLVEVMETPTPVSALLHAGLLNAGPFIIVRMAFLMDAVYIAPIVLVVVGAISAIYGSIVYITQPSVKTALSYSSVAHMGFTLMTCGFGVYAAAMLHLTGHSFYKAHAFLSSGTNIEKSGASKFQSIKRFGNIGKIVLGITTSIGIYLGIAVLWGFDFNADFKLLIVGGVIVLGLTQLLVQTYDSDAKIKVLFGIIGRTIILTLSFFTFESAMHHLLVSELPIATPVNGTYLALMTFVLAAFSIVILIQVFAPRITQNKLTSNLGVHIRNGFYLNVYFDRLINAYKK